MLHIDPVHWYSWDVTVTDGSRPLAGIAMSWWCEKAVLTIDDAIYRVYREAPMSGAFVVEHAGRVLARAHKPSVFRREFAIHHAGRGYTLRAESTFGWAFVLLDGSRPVGSIAAKGAFTRHAVADLPDDLPLPVRIFIVWLMLILWRRRRRS